MERIKQQKALRNRVASEPGNDRLACRTGLEDDLHDAIDPRAVDFHQKLHKFFGRTIRSRCGRLFEVADEHAQPLDLPLKFFFACHDPPSNAGPNRVLCPGPLLPTSIF